MKYNYVTNRQLTGNKSVTVRSDEVDFIEKRSFGFGAEYVIELKDGRRIYVDKDDAERLSESSGVRINQDDV